MYQHAQNKQHSSNQLMVIQQQHIYNQYQQQQQNFYHMSQPHSHSNSINLSTFNNHLNNNHANNSNNQISQSTNHSNNQHQNYKHNKTQKQDNQLNSKSIAGQKQAAVSDIEKKLLNYIPSLIHDLRNPLQQLVACIELYKIQLNQMQNPLYEILLHSVTHMNELITKSLTTFKKITERQDDGQICEFQYKSIDISKYLEEFWTNNLAIAEQKSNVDYQILVQSTLPHYVNIPKLEVTQVIQNLFSNATKFTEKGSIKLIVSFHEMPEDDNANSSTQGQQENSTTPSNQIEETQSNCKKTHIDHSQINKQHLDCGKESSPLDQDVSIAIEGQQKSHFQQQNDLQEQNEVRQQAMSLGNRTSFANASNQQPQFSSATHLPNLKSKEMRFVMLQQKLQSITYQFDKLKYSHQQDNDYQLNTEEDVEEDYSESENNFQNAHFAHSYSNNQKTMDEYYEYFQNDNLNPHNQHNKLNYNGQQKKKLFSQYNFSTQSHLSSHQPNKQSNNNTNNGSTPNNQNVNAIAQDNNQNNIHSFNQIENSNTSSTSRSCHNSTPPTFQIHTFSDIQNPKNNNQQHSNMIKSQQLTSSSKQNAGENGMAGTNQSKQYHTPQMSSKNDFYALKNQVFNQKSQQNTREQKATQSQITQQLVQELKNKNFCNECPSPEISSMYSQSKNEFQARDNIHSFYSDVNPEVKNQPGSADLEGQQKSIKLSTVMKQQQINKQNKALGQGQIQNSYYYNCQQKQTSQSSGDLRTVKNQFFVGPIHNPGISQSQQQQPKEQQQQEDHINSQHTHNKSINSQNYEKIPNNKEYCQIFSKRKSQIHPSIRDLVFNRNNIRNFQIRQVAKIKGYLKFEILDTGKGMDESEQKKIFDIYQQANNSIKEHYGGSGIGLYSAKNIANQLKGEIFCHSQKGVGSAFIFYMPCTATYKTESNEEDSTDQFQFETTKKQNSTYKSNNQVSENEHFQDKNQLIITKTTSQTEKSANLNQYNLGSGQLKSSQDKQQQLQISQIKQGLKIADSYNQNLDQQNKLVLTKQQQQVKLNQSPSEKKEEEIKILISKLEQRQKKIRVIYIDDNQFLLQTMENILSKIKCVELIVEKNPLEALKTIKQNPQKFDIALIDHEMPELDGKKLASEIKLINSNIKLICHSGYEANSEFTQDCIQSGFSYFLQKPFYLENIVVLFCKILHVDLQNLIYINTSLQPFNILKNN